MRVWPHGAAVSDPWGVVTVPPRHIVVVAEEADVLDLCVFCERLHDLTPSVYSACALLFVLVFVSMSIISRIGTCIVNRIIL